MATKIPDFCQGFLFIAFFAINNVIKKQLFSTAPTKILTIAKI